MPTHPTPAGQARDLVDPIWGERPGESVRSSISLGSWDLELTGHGLEHIAFAGATVVPRLFFAVRDLSWATPPTPLSYKQRPAVNDGPAEVGADFQGSVAGYPLQVSGSVVLAPQAVTVSFRLEVSGDVEVSRAGPCLLLDVPAPGQVIVTDVTGPDGTVMVGPGISPHPLASGHRKLSVPMRGGRLAVELLRSVVRDGRPTQLGRQYPQVLLPSIKRPAPYSAENRSGPPVRSPVHR